MPSTRVCSDKFQFFRSIFEFIGDVVQSSTFHVAARVPTKTYITSVELLATWLRDSPVIKGNLSAALSIEQQGFIQVLVNAAGLVSLNPLNGHIRNFMGSAANTGSPRFLASYASTYNLRDQFALEYQNRQRLAMHSLATETGSNSASSNTPPYSDSSDAFMPLFPDTHAPQSETPLFSVPDLTLIKIFGVTQSRSDAGRYTVRIMLKSSALIKRGSSRTDKQIYSVNSTQPSHDFASLEEAVAAQAIFIMNEVDEVLCVRAWIRKLVSTPASSAIMPSMLLPSLAAPGVWDRDITDPKVEVDLLLFVANICSKIEVINTWYVSFANAFILQRLRSLGVEGDVAVPRCIGRPATHAPDDAEEASVQTLSSPVTSYAGIQLDESSPPHVRQAFEVALIN